MRLVLLTLAFALATVAIGWWGVPLVGLVWGGMSGRRPGGRRKASGSRASWFAGLAAAVAWGVLVGWLALRAPVADLARILADVTRVPAPGLVVITLLLPAALAWSAAEIGVLARRTFTTEPFVVP